MKNSIVCSKKPNIVWISEKLIEDRFDANPFKAEYIEDEIKESKFYKCKTINDILRSNKDLTGGSTPLGANYIESGIRFIRTQDVDFNWIDIDNTVFISEEDDKKLKRSSLEVDDVLLTITGVKFGKSAPVRKTCLPANISQHSVKMHFKEGVDPYYISTFLNCLYGQKQIFKKSVGATRPAIDYSGIKTIKIPIPSPEIQKYIGDKVRKAEELREDAKILKKDAEDILYNELKQEEFLEKQKTIINKFMWLNNKDIETRIDSEYYKPNYILYKHILKKNGIMTLKIKDIVKEIKTGTTPESNFIMQEEQNIKFLRVNNLDYCFLNEDDLLYIDNNYEEKKLRFLQQEDILVSIAGTLGRSSVVDTNNCTTNQNIAALTLRNINDIRPYYLSLYFNSYFGKLSLDTISTQATVKYVNNELLGGIEIPIIKIDTQILIEKKVIEYKNKLNNSKQLIKQAKQDIEDLIEGNFDMSKIKETN